MICAYQPFPFDENSYKQGKSDMIEIYRDALTGEMKTWYFDTDLQAAHDDPCVIDAMVDLAIRTVKSVGDKLKGEIYEPSDRV